MYIIERQEISDDGDDLEYDKLVAQGEKTGAAGGVSDDDLGALEDLGPISDDEDLDDFNLLQSKV